MKRFLSLLLTVAMLATMFATMVLPAAAEGVAFKASFDTSYFTNGNSAVIVVAETADATYYVDGWSNVAFKNQEGFMSNLYLDDENLSKYPKAKNNGNYVNFRKDPSLNGEIISQLFEGKTFDVISIADGWIYKEIDGKNGYIFYDKEYIQI